MDTNSVGPQIPPHILERRKRAAEKEAAKASSANSGTAAAGSTEATKKRRIAGPAPPPAPLEEMPKKSPKNEHADDTSSDDDDFGPALPTLAQTEEEEEEEAKRRLSRFQKIQDAADAEDKKPKRDEWMIRPPKPEDWASKVDPTKIRNRKFQTGKGAKAPIQVGGDSNLWTETPDEKRKRLEDEIMGRKKPATLGPYNNKNVVGCAEAAETARRIKEYNEKNRNKSLYDEHKTKARIEEDDPSKRAFDREKDIAGSRKINHQQKKEMLNRAAGFGSRFSSGNYL